MAKRSKHPDKALLDYLSGSLDSENDRLVREHLSSCDECSRFASLVRAMKRESQAAARSDSGPYATQARGEIIDARKAELPARSTPSAQELATPGSLKSRHIDLYSKPELPGTPMLGAHGHFEEAAGGHPTSEELASLFYAKPARQSAATRLAPLIAHVAVCGECSVALGEYWRAETAASDPALAEPSQGETPGWVFKKINEWEDSAFGQTKPAEEVLSQNVLNRLLAMVRTGGRGLQEAIQKHLTHSSETVAHRTLVPVIMVNRQGEAHGVEMFHYASSQSGERLEHQEGSKRFEGRRLVAIREAAAPRPCISVGIINQSSASLHNERLQEETAAAHYFLLDE